jgi:hypothetical protein
MALPDPAPWSDRLRRALSCYGEPLLRAVAGRLLRPRNQWPAEELIERCVAAVANPAVLDRRLQEREPTERRLLTLIAHSHQPLWRLGNLVELGLALGHADGLRPVFALLEAGLLFPVLPEAAPPLASFEQWVGLAGSAGLTVFAHPLVASRARGEDLGLPALPSVIAETGAPQEGDGLEWPLRLAAVWQQVASGPLRRTQGGSFFKRDLDRLRQDPLLSGPPADSLADLPDPALLAVALAEAEGLLPGADGELRAGPLPASWQEGLSDTLGSLYAGLFRLESWDAQAGFRLEGEEVGNPFPSAYLLAVELLARLPEGAWARPADVEAWLLGHHPYWKDEGGRMKDESEPAPGSSSLLLHPSSFRSGWVGAFLLGLLYPLRVVQAAKGDTGEWLVRLAPLGRWLLGQAEEPPAAAAYPQTLLVQPNLEILAYRQGLTPALIARLSQFAAWKALGAACTLQLLPETVYRALEAGLTFETIRETLERHGTRATPAPVIDSLRTWAQKRDRITVYPAAALLEFASAVELDEALARGVPAQRLTDRLALVAHEGAIEFKHFRLQ